LAAKGARNIILKEMWNIGLKGPARTIEESACTGAGVTAASIRTATERRRLQ
jgi:hypothetical protein